MVSKIAALGPAWGSRGERKEYSENRVHLTSLEIGCPNLLKSFAMSSLYPLATSPLPRLYYTAPARIRSHGCRQRWHASME